MITFLITTYNRQESCQKLVATLQGLGNIIVLNDGCDYKIENCTQYFLPAHLGKQGYWRMVNILFKKRGTADYYFMLPDDFLPTEDMTSEAIRLWEGIEDQRKMCLNLLADRIGIKSWTGFTPIDKGDVWLSQWVDMCFMCEDSFFYNLGEIPKINLNWVVRPKMSSGVGAFISRKLYRLKFNLYQVKESLVTYQEEHTISQMKINDNVNSTFSVNHNTRKRPLPRTQIPRRPSR